MKVITTSLTLIGLLAACVALEVMLAPFRGAQYALTFAQRVLDGMRAQEAT